MKSMRLRDSDGMSYNIEEFRNLYELSKTIEGRETLPQWNRDNIYKTELEEDFHGVSSVQEAHDIMTGGYVEPLEDMVAFSKSLNTKTVEKRFKFQNSVVGFVPVVPLAILGVPNNMIDMRMKSMKTKVIELVYDCGAVCSYSAEDMKKAGKVIAEAIISLEKKNYRVSLKIMLSFWSRKFDPEKQTQICLVTVKEANQPLDTKRILFPIMHPAMFRVIEFEWQQKAPGNKFLPCRGTGMSQAIKGNDSDLRKKIKEILGIKNIYLNYGDASQGIKNVRRIIENA